MRLYDLFEAKQPWVDPTLTPAFKSWFGQSKVVDHQGRPLRCYHGTTSHFHTFSSEDAPYRGGLLAFFSTDPKFASGYATENEGGNIIPVYLKIEKPYDYRSPIERNMPDWFYEETGGIQDKREANRILMGLGHQIDDIDDDTTPDLTVDQFARAVLDGSWDALEAPEYVHYLREGGYDGIVLLENDAVNFGVFEANQVKSAISNQTFSGESDHIGESFGWNCPSSDG